MKRFAFLLLSALINLLLSAQKLPVSNITTKEGLAHSTIFEIFQDSRGTVWFGTDGNGLCSYNGNEYRVYKESDGLIGNTVRSIVEDSLGMLWLGTNKGLSCFNGWEFENYTHQHGIKGEIITQLFIDSKNNLWALTNNGGVNKIKRHAKDSISITNIGTKEGLTNNFVLDIAETPSGSIWLALIGGINIIDEHTNEIEKIAVPGNFATSLCPISKDSVLCGTYDNGLFLVTPNGETIVNSLAYFDKRIWSINRSLQRQILGWKR